MSNILETVTLREKRLGTKMFLVKKYFKPNKFYIYTINIYWATDPTRENECKLSAFFKFRVRYSVNSDRIYIKFVRPEAFFNEEHFCAQTLFFQIYGFWDIWQFTNLYVESGDAKQVTTWLRFFDNNSWSQCVLGCVCVYC